MLYYQNVVLLNAFYRHQIVLFFKGSAIRFFTSYLLFNRACSEPVHFSASCSVKIGFKNTIAKKELPEAERKKNYCCVAKTRPIWLQKLFSIGEGPSDFMPIYPRSE